MKYVTEDQRLWASQVTWEATYTDGTVYRESEGGAYRGIDRNLLKSFRIVAPGLTLLEIFAQDGRTGHNLCYRRRTGITQGGKRLVWFIVGWVPQGPIYGVDVANEEIVTAPGFAVGNPVFYPPAPMEEEGERFTFTEKSHGTDAALSPEEIVLPTGFVLRNDT